MLHTEEAAISTRARERGLRALGTLGSGNHFLELQTVGKTVDAETAEKWGLYEGQLVAMIHSGSRGLGHQVCSDHVRALESRYTSEQRHVGRGIMGLFPTRSATRCSPLPQQGRPVLF